MKLGQPTCLSGHRPPLVQVPSAPVAWMPPRRHRKSAGVYLHAALMCTASNRFPAEERAQAVSPRHSRRLMNRRGVPVLNRIQSASKLELTRQPSSPSGLRQDGVFFLQQAHYSIQLLVRLPLGGYSMLPMYRPRVLPLRLLWFPARLTDPRHHASRR